MYVLKYEAKKRRRCRRKAQNCCKKYLCHTVDYFVFEEQQKAKAEIRAEGKRVLENMEREGRAGNGTGSSNVTATYTYAYDTAALATQQEREAKAAQRIFGLLPEDQREEMLALFQEFEDYETPEARFAHVLDNLQPLMLNDSNNGGDWREHQVKRSQVYKRNARTSTGSETLWAYMEGLIQGNVAKGNIQDC